MNMQSHVKSLEKDKYNKTKKIKRRLKKKNKKFCRLNVKIISNPVLFSIEEYSKQDGKHVGIFTNKDVLERITINTIRHELTNYDKLVKNLDMSKTELFEFKKYTNDKIYKKYCSNFINDEITELRITCLISL